MNKIRIITDSASDISKAAADELGIAVLPVPILHEGKEYLDRVDITNEEFYNLLLSSQNIPTTSQINTIDYVEEYKKAHYDGVTHLINVTINAKGSNIYNSAKIAKNTFYEETGITEKDMVIEVIDSKAYSLGYGIAVVEAAKMAAKDIDFETIKEFLYDYFSRLEVIFSVYSLDQLKKSGRVSAAAAFAGELLGFRPILIFIDGEAKIYGKIRGDKNVVPGVIDIIKQRAKDIDKYPCGILTGLMYSEIDLLSDELKREFNLTDLPLYSCGAAISINSGPKVVAVAYAGEKRNT